MPVAKSYHVRVYMHDSAMKCISVQEEFRSSHVCRVCSKGGKNGKEFEFINRNKNVFFSKKKGNRLWSFRSFPFIKYYFSRSVLGRSLPFMLVKCVLLVDCFILRNNTNKTHSHYTICRFIVKEKRNKNSIYSEM